MFSFSSSLRNFGLVAVGPVPSSTQYAWTPPQREPVTRLVSSTARIEMPLEFSPRLIWRTALSSAPPVNTFWMMPAARSVWTMKPPSEPIFSPAPCAAACSCASGSLRVCRVVAL